MLFTNPAVILRLTQIALKLQIHPPIVSLLQLLQPLMSYTPEAFLVTISTLQVSASSDQVCPLFTIPSLQLL